MILLDDRVGSKELLPYVKRLGVSADLTRLDFGDACWEGKGPGGSNILIGVERKTLGDMLNCIDDARYAGHQRPGMLGMYAKSILMLEGVWKPDMQSGYLMTLYHTLTWTPFRYRTMMVKYHKLFRYLLSVQLSGVIITLSRDLEHTAFNIVECYQYFKKPWEQHTSLMEVQQLAIPSLTTKPSLLRRWASALDGVGVERSQDAERHFKRPIALAAADESEWLQVPGIGPTLARRIVADILGIRRG